jgi:hypothetical protein
MYDRLKTFSFTEEMLKDKNLYVYSYQLQFPLQAPGFPKRDTF